MRLFIILVTLSGCSANFLKPLSLNQVVIVGSSTTSSISSYKINKTTGQLRLSSSLKVSGTPIQAVSSPTGNNIYVANGQTAGGIFRFSLNVSSGALNYLDYISAVNTDSGPTGMFINPAGTHLYLSNNATAGPGKVEYYRIAGIDGALSHADIPDSLVGNAAQGLFRSDGEYLWMITSTSGSGNAVKCLFAANGYSISSVTGVTLSNQPITFAARSDYAFLYLANFFANSLSIITVNSSSGTLTKVLPTLTGIDTPIAIAVHPLGYVYVLSYATGTLNLLTSDTNTGQLTLVPSASVIVNALGGTKSLSMRSDGKYLYVGDYLGDAVNVYEVDSATGTMGYRWSMPVAKPDLVKVI